MSHEWANALIAFQFDVLNPANDFVIDGVSQGRGLNYFEEIPAGAFSTACGSWRVIAFVATPAVLWDPGRAYKVTLHSQIHSGRITESNCQCPYSQPAVNYMSLRLVIPRGHWFRSPVNIRQGCEYGH